VTDVATLGRLASARRQQLDRLAGEAAQVARSGIEARDRAAVLQSALETHELVSRVLTQIGEERQESAQRQVEELVTRALQVVFGENLSFHVVQSVKANRAEVDFVLRSTYGEQVIDTPVMEARGGGMAAVVGFVLRLVVLLLTPGARRFLALDESFAHVSASYEPRVAEFLREVADKADVQILLVTHSTAYGDLADARYRLTLGSDGITKVEEGASE
jgi:ABC-type uncharacterized transport system YnjBCD ATPase subunit